MEGKWQENPSCFNLKLPDLQCQQCIWLEWNEKSLTCLNRKRMICSLYVEEIFGDLLPKTIN